MATYQEVTGLILCREIRSVIFLPLRSATFIGLLRRWNTFDFYIIKKNAWHCSQGKENFIFIYSRTFFLFIFLYFVQCQIKIYMFKAVNDDRKLLRRRRSMHRSIACSQRKPNTHREQIYCNFEPKNPSLSSGFKPSLLRQIVIDLPLEPLPLQSTQSGIF